MTDQMRKGIAFAVITAVISGISIFYNKLIIVKGLDPLIFNILKNGGVAAILSVLLFSFSPQINLRRLPGKTWKNLFLIGLVGGSIPFILFFEGLRTSSAVNATLIHKSLFIWVTVAALPLLGEKLSVWQIIGFTIVAWSNLFIGGFSSFRGDSGEFMILAATFFWTAEVILAKITLKDVDNLIVSWGRMFFGSIFLVVIALLWGKLSLILRVKPEQLIIVSGSILLLTGYVVSWFKALKYAPANVVTSVLILATPITNILSAIFITHTFSLTILINLLGTFVGIGLIVWFLPSAKTSKINLRPNLSK